MIDGNESVISVWFWPGKIIWPLSWYGSRIGIALDIVSATLPSVPLDQKFATVVAIKRLACAFDYRHNNGLLHVQGHLHDVAKVSVATDVLKLVFDLILAH